jgi:hypothetical protein
VAKSRSFSIRVSKRLRNPIHETRSPKKARVFRFQIGRGWRGDESVKGDSERLRTS